jgi:hypothetical protein
MLVSGAVGAIASGAGLTVPAGAAYSPQPVSLPWHPAGAVHSSVARGGVVYLGGQLNGTGGVAAVDATNGTLLWMVPADNDVRALALSPDGSRLYAGGAFTTIDGVSRHHLAAINVADHSQVTPWKGRTWGNVRDLVVRGNTLYVAGRTQKIDGVVQRGLGAVDATTGVRDASFGLSADNDVLGLALTGNQLLISGAFTQVDGSPRASLAAIDLSTNTLTGWTPPRLCSTCDQYWDVQTDGTNAYVASSGPGGTAGAFDLTTGAQPWHSIRGDGDMQALWLPGDGRLYLGGHFGQTIRTGSTIVNASVVAAVFTANGQIDTAWTPKIYNTYPGCWTITSSPGKLWVGGNFSGEQVGGQNNHMPYLAAYPDPTASPDHQPPTGTFATDTATAWAKFTKVRVVQSDINDDQTIDALIGRKVTWGDGTTRAWTSGDTLSHVYRTSGTFTPRVTLTDQAGNAATITTSAVTVKVDAAAPVVTFRRPRHEHSVLAWRTLHGKVTDAGTGVKKVSGKAVEERGGTWYGYDAKAHGWLKAATKAKAFARSTKFTARVDARHRWTAKLALLRKGTLICKVWAADQVKNRSSTVARRATLTHT